MKELMNKHKQLLKTLFYFLLFFLLALLVKHEMGTIDWRLFLTALSQLSTTTRFLLIFFGLLGFSFNGWYDFCATRNYKLTATPLDILKMGWISQAFNEFIGLGGFTGGALRASFYQKAGLSTKDSLQITLETWFASFLGLGFLVIGMFIEQPPTGVYRLLAIAYCLYFPLFFFWEHLPFVGKWVRKTGYIEISYQKKFRYCLVSLGDWLASFSYFYLVMTLFLQDVTPGLALMVYACSNVIGILSFVPGGLGTFDMSVLFLFQQAGFSGDRILAGIVVLRVCYYVVPWMLACCHVFHEWLSDHLFEGNLQTANIARFVGRFVSASLFLNGVLLIASVFSPAIPERIRLLKYFIPRFFQNVSVLIVLLTGVILLLISYGLFKRIKRALWIALIILPIGAVACLVKGLDYEEAIFLWMNTYLLYQTRYLFTRNHLPLNRKTIMTTFMMCFFFLLIIFYLANHVTALRTIRKISLLNPTHILMYLIILLSLTVMILFTRTDRITFLPPNEKEIRQFEDLVNQYGGSEYSHLVYLYDKMIFFNEDQTVAILYRPSGDNLVALGDPIGKTEDFQEALEEFLLFSEQTNMTAGFYEVSPHSLDAFCSLGYATMKIGESAQVDLEAFSFDGKKNKNRRSVRNDMERAGLQFEVLNPPFDPSFLEDIRKISDTWLKGRDEMSFSLGTFQEDYLNRERIALLRDDLQIYAFATIMPISNEKVSIDLMRYLTHPAGDVMQMLILQLLQWSKDQGYQIFDLGMAPLANVGSKSFSSSRDKTLHLAYNFGNRFYGFKGLRNYKQKFRPRWENRYVIYSNQSALVKLLIALLDITHRSNG